MLAVALLASNLMLVGSLWAAVYLFKRWSAGIEARTRSSLSEAVRAVVEPAGPEEPSLLAVYSDQVATILAARIMQQLKAGIAGVASGQAREVQSEALANMAGRSPWLAVLSGLLPAKYRKALLAAPQFTGQLRQGQDQGDNHNTQKSDVAERLKYQ